MHIPTAICPSFHFFPCMPVRGLLCSPFSSLLLNITPFFFQLTDEWENAPILHGKHCTLHFHSFAKAWTPSTIQTCSATHAAAPSSSGPVHHWSATTPFHMHSTPHHFAGMSRLSASSSLTASLRPTLMAYSPLTCSSSIRITFPNLFFFKWRRWSLIIFCANITYVFERSRICW